MYFYRHKFTIENDKAGSAGGLPILAFLIFVLASCSLSTGYAQSNPCDQTSYGQWYELRSTGCQPPPCGAAVCFKPERCYGNGKHTCHNGLRWKWYNDAKEEGAYIKFKFDCRFCDGTIETTEQTLYLDRTGVWEDAGNYVLSLPIELARPPYDIRYFSPNKTKAKEQVAPANAVIKKYTDKYSEVQTAINKVKDPSQRNNFQTRLNNNHSLFEQYKATVQTQQSAGNGNGMSQAMDKMKQQTNKGRRTC